jgi:predicted TIM-barrel fold metal-dependent hydrolase
MIGHAQALDGLDALGLDDEARELFLAGNAQRLLGL